MDPAPRREWIVLHAPSHPGGYQPTPNTVGECRRFVSEYGGQIFWRWTCSWQELDDTAPPAAPPIGRVLMEGQHSA